MRQHEQMEIQIIKHIQMPYGVSEQVFQVLEKGYTQVWKRKILVLPVLLPYQNDNELITLILRCGKMCLSRTLSSRQT